jgi:predicted TIM-barrel fold metal-dependent hydrolase
MINKNGLMVMLHVPRDARFREPVNIAQIQHICETYPNIRLVIAHVGRAYCKCDIGDAFEKLKDYKDLYYDFTANTNAYVFEELLKNVSEDKILFGSDEPIVRMRMHRIEENNTYINLIPPGLYGDPKQAPHLREVSEEEGKKLTFFMYEEILAMKEATTKLGLGKETVNKLFYENSRKLLDELESKVRA